MGRDGQAGPDDRPTGEGRASQGRLLGSRPRRVVAGVTAACLALGGYIALDIADVVPGVLTRDTRAQAEPSAEPSAEPIDAVGPRPSTSSRTSLPVAVAGTHAPLPTAGGLADRLTPALADPALGPSVGLDVRDGLTGRSLFAHDAATPRTPASTTKLLTAAAITHAVDGRKTLDTRVVAGRTPDDIVLVAGGDMLLAPGRGDPSAVAGRAGIADLARQVAAALHAQGRPTVRIHLDDAYARGPATAPLWEAADVAAGITGPVVMLGTTDARAVPGRAAPADPALHATSRLAAELTRLGIRVTGRPDRTPAPPGARQLGVVHSAPRSEVLALALDESDNALTESLARSAAVDAASISPTFPAVAGWIREQLATQGISVEHVTLVDASGLSRATRAPASTVADTLALASTGTSPALADVVSRLPVAGLTGTLHDRFLGADAHTAAGIARAKTGTLTGVHALGGTVVDADGRLLVYAVLADRAGGTPQARAALDRVVAALAACGCR